jgi:hypothetical protein
VAIYGSRLGPRHPMVSCPRCKCCSLGEPTDPESCVGACLPCSHHEDCIECERKDREITKLRNLILDFAAEAERI